MLEHCSFIEDMDVRYDGEQRIIEISNRLIRFTPTEYKLVHLLLTNRSVKEAVLFDTLSLHTTDKANARLLTKYIDKIRYKLSSHNLYLYRICGYGYALLPREKTGVTGVGIDNGNSRISVINAHTRHA